MIISQFVNNEVSGNSLCLRLVSYSLFLFTTGPKPAKKEKFSHFIMNATTPPLPNFSAPKTSKKKEIPDFLDLASNLLLL